MLRMLRRRLHGRIILRNFMHFIMRRSRRLLPRSVTLLHVLQSETRDRGCLCVELHPSVPDSPLRSRRRDSGVRVLQSLNLLLGSRATCLRSAAQDRRGRPESRDRIEPRRPGGQLHR